MVLILGLGDVFLILFGGFSQYPRTPLLASEFRLPFWLLLEVLHWYCYTFLEGRWSPRGMLTYCVSIVGNKQHIFHRYKANTNLHKK